MIIKFDIILSVLNYNVDFKSWFWFYINYINCTLILMILNCQNINLCQICPKQRSDEITIINPYAIQRQYNVAVESRVELLSSNLRRKWHQSKNLSW